MNEEILPQADEPSMNDQKEASIDWAEIASLNGHDEVSHKRNKFARLLSERNTLRQELAELHRDNEVYKSLSLVSETNAASSQAASLPKSESSFLQIPVWGDEDESEKKIFLAKFPLAEKHLEDIQWIRKDLPNVSWEYAYRIACPDRFSQFGFEEKKQALASLDTSNTASAENLSVPLATLSADELEAKATELWKQNRIRI